MKLKTLKELRSLDTKNLNQEFGAIKDYLANIYFEHSQGNLKDTSQLKKLRVYISRIETIKNERQEDAVTTAPAK